MKAFEDFDKKDWKRCQWRGAGETFRHLATSNLSIQAKQVVKPLHWYIACRLVIEGGFLPDEIKPHPPFRAAGRRKRWQLVPAPDLATGSEATVLGG